ncbi:dethiobiotin synthase [Tardibacter chloracetimidivorans]|uniref:ATP-dependent dethiobiotin synthetase BioD n=1 Tax=Tardibacter chloracetimidivorans TaxID=1921510 RepID=A0A1L3ZRS7_9SPHN|nr:dethiobiotin synthase [Tardibacter chloracetimidivorans]API58333.1 dethiobiotin synthase [Tardibacter chloracetimidivorans]
MAGLFITASGTDIGKTVVTALLARQLRARGQTPDVLKPVLSGFDPATPATSDAGVLLSALDLPVTATALDRISPWRFRAPLSPDMAAAREGRTVPFDDLVDHCRDRLAAAAGPLLIEGVGGAMVPLDDCHTVLDWMAALALPALLVSGTYLGAISHTLTALAALDARGISVSGIVLSTSAGSSVDAGETREPIARFAAVPVIVLPRLAIGADGVPSSVEAPDLTGLVT